MAQTHTIESSVHGFHSMKKHIGRLLFFKHSFIFHETILANHFNHNMSHEMSLYLIKLIFLSVLYIKFILISILYVKNPNESVYIVVVFEAI